MKFNIIESHHRNVRRVKLRIRVRSIEKMIRCHFPLSSIRSEHEKAPKRFVE